jgi:hypothetical protein
VPSLGIGAEAVKFRPRILRTRNSGVDVFAYNFPSATYAVLANLAQLHLGVLSAGCGGKARIDYGSHRGSFVSCFLRVMLPSRELFANSRLAVLGALGDISLGLPGVGLIGALARVGE